MLRRKGPGSRATPGAFCVTAWNKLKKVPFCSDPKFTQMVQLVLFKASYILYYGQFSESNPRK
jgi:hypothetical protein